MKTIIFILIIVFGYHSSVFCQLNDQIKNTDYIFWKEGISLKYDDYKGPSFPNTVTVVAELGIWTALDISEHSTINAKNRFRFYIAPVFIKKNSHADTNDSIFLEVNNIYFDICEFCARIARKKLETLSDSVLITTTISSIFKSIVKEMHETRLRMNREFYREYIRNKNQTALLTWRNKLNEDLKKTEKWATKSIDCNRFLINEPLENGYKEDLTANPVLLKDYYEQVLAPDTWHAGLNQISRFKISAK